MDDRTGAGREGTGRHSPRLGQGRVPERGRGCVCACAVLSGRGSGDPGESGLPRGRAPRTTPAKSPRTPVLEPPSPAEGAGGRVCGMRRPEGREGNRRARLLPSLQTPGDPRAGGRIPSGDDGARPRATYRCHPGEGRPTAQPPPRAPAPRGRLSPAAPRPAKDNPRTTLSSYACAPSAEGRPGSGGDEEPARCASGGRAKNNCGVLATAFPLAGRARRRLRIGALPQPVSRRGCAQRGAVPGAARELPGVVVAGGEAPRPAPPPGVSEGSGRAGLPRRSGQESRYTSRRRGRWQAGVACRPGEGRLVGMTVPGAARPPPRVTGGWRAPAPAKGEPQPPASKVKVLA